MEERLQKVMAQAGVASRRASEEMIAAGRVTVNGKVVTEMGIKVNAGRDRIAVDGELLQIGASRVYIKVNKPMGVLSTVADPHGRRTVLDLVDAPGRLYPVGRLDYDSEGLILLTNDGELTALLTHPRYGHAKTYLTLVRGNPTDEALERLKVGVELEDGPSKALEVVRVVGQPRSAPGMTLPSPAGMVWLEVTIYEGRNHLVRRMMDVIGHPVERLIRVSLGPLLLGDLRPGQSRYLTSMELNALREAIGKRTRGTKGRRSPSSRSQAERKGRSATASRPPAAPKGRRGPSSRPPAAKPRRDGPPAAGKRPSSSQKSTPQGEKGARKTR